MKTLRPDCWPTLAGGLLLFALAGVASAEDQLAADVAAVQDHWAIVAYETPKPQRLAAYEVLAKEAEAARAAHPGDAAALTWEGIVLSSWAGERGGLGALGLAKRARKDFEDAITLDPAALAGSASTSLGTLYYQVPGWPIGFGDDVKARELLQKGLAHNPDGIDSNYFYGDFLFDQDDLTGAEAALAKSVAAPARPGREMADQGRRKEAGELLAKVRAKLASR